MVQKERKKTLSGKGHHRARGYRDCTQVVMAGARLGLALRIVNENSEMNLLVQFLNRRVQVVEKPVIKTVISMEKDTASFLLMSLRICQIGLIVMTEAPIEAQQPLQNFILRINAQLFHSSGEYKVHMCKNLLPCFFCEGDLWCLACP
jgi:hypothetical protein